MNSFPFPKNWLPLWRPVPGRGLVPVPEGYAALGGTKGRFFWYERNLPGSGYSSALYGTGCRWYAMLSGRPVPGLSLGVRIARTWYADGRTSIGSGDDMTQGNHRTDIGAYIQWRL